MQEERPASLDRRRCRCTCRPAEARLRRESDFQLREQRLPPPTPSAAAGGDYRDRTPGRARGSSPSSESPAASHPPRLGSCRQENETERNKSASPSLSGVFSSAARRFWWRPGGCSGGGCGRDQGPGLARNPILTTLLLLPIPATFSFTSSAAAAAGSSPPQSSFHQSGGGGGGSYFSTSGFLSASVSLLLILLLQHQQQAVAGGQSMPTCPEVCSCKWTNGKETVDCYSANFNVVPDVLDPGTQVLDLTKNKLSHLSAFVFARVHLINLQRIRLESCSLKSIDDQAFANLTNLVELDLSDNQLAAVPSRALSAVPGLRELRLNGNKIPHVPRHAFVALPNLSRLEMSRCDLVDVDPAAFAALRHMRTLRLDANRLQTLRPGVFEPLVNLHGVLLHENPWRCDCHLLATRKWMEDRKVPLTVPPACAAPPRLADTYWTRLELDEYACAPTVQAVRDVVRGYAGRNVTVACTARGSPGAEVFWEARNKHLVSHSFLPAPAPAPPLPQLQPAPAGGVSNPSSPASSSANSSSLLSSSATLSMEQQELSRQQQQMVTIWESDRPGRQEVELVRTSYLTVVDAHESNSGVFVCVASNKAGKASANVTLVVVREGKLKLRGLLSSGITTGLALFGVLLLFVLFCVLSGVVIKRKRRRNRNSSLSGAGGNFDSTAGREGTSAAQFDKLGNFGGVRGTAADGDLLTTLPAESANNWDDDGGSRNHKPGRDAADATVLSNHAVRENGSRFDVAANRSSPKVDGDVIQNMGASVADDGDEEDDLFPKVGKTPPAPAAPPPSGTNQNSKSNGSSNKLSSPPPSSESANPSLKNNKPGKSANCCPQDVVSLNISKSNQELSSSLRNKPLSLPARDGNRSESPQTTVAAAKNFLPHSKSIEADHLRRFAVPGVGSQPYQQQQTHQPSGRIISNAAAILSSTSRRGGVEADQQSMQLQNFMDEYQSLQEQLRKVKQRYKQAPLAAAPADPCSDTYDPLRAATRKRIPVEDPRAQEALLGRTRTAKDAGDYGPPRDLFTGSGGRDPQQQRILEHPRLLFPDTTRTIASGGSRLPSYRYHQLDDDVDVAAGEYDALVPGSGAGSGYFSPSGSRSSGIFGRGGSSYPEGHHQHHHSNRIITRSPPTEGYLI